MNELTDKEVFEQTLEALRKNGWVKGFLEDGRGRMCLWGGVSYVLHGNAFYGSDTHKYGDILSDIAREQFPERMDEERFTPWSHAVDFNNHEDTTFNEIEMVLEKAIANCEG